MSKKILELATTMQSVALLGENVKLAKKKKVQVKDMVGVGIKNIIGTSLIKEQANIIGGM